MDAGDFKTLGECDFGTIWEVQSENRIVVNAYQAALYFSKDHFFEFAKMIEDSVRTLTGKGFHPSPQPQATAPVHPEEPPTPTKEVVTHISDFVAFRKNRSPGRDDDDFPS